MFWTNPGASPKKEKLVVRGGLAPRWLVRNHLSRSDYNAGASDDPRTPSRIAMASTTNTPNLPTNIIPTNIAWLKLSGKSPVCLGIPPLRIKIMFESNPLKSTMLVGRLGVQYQVISYDIMIVWNNIVYHTATCGGKASAGAVAPAPTFSRRGAAEVRADGGATP